MAGLRGVVTVNLRVAARSAPSSAPASSPGAGQHLSGLTPPAEGARARGRGAPRRPASSCSSCRPTATSSR